MTQSRSSSLTRFDDYKHDLHSGTPSTPNDRRHRRRERSALSLLRDFWGLLDGFHLAILLSLATLTVATLLTLIPPAATKFVVDYVLGDRPLPDTVPAWVPRDRWPLLVLVVGGVLLISFFKLTIHIWGRWHATRVTHLLQLSVRRKVLNHAVRLPLHRVHELKAGGAASILREDARAVGELVFGMLYNPWRALIQLLGSLAILAWVDWRLLLGAVVVIPLVFVTHRTWINRIRPQHRRIRAQREEVDAQTTESFGGCAWCGPSPDSAPRSTASCGATT